MDTITKNKKRAERRHHRERIKNRVKSFADMQYDKAHDPEAYEYRLVRRIDTRQPCSCEGCGNPRRYGEKSLQERKAYEIMKDYEF